MQPAVTTTKAFANYQHIVLEQKKPGLYVFSGQGHRIAETDPAVYRGRIVNADQKVSYNVQEATRGVLDNIQRALKTQNLTLEQLNTLTVYVTNESMLLEVHEVLGKLPFKPNDVVVTELPGLNIVEMEGTACSDPTSLETVYPQGSFVSTASDVPNAVKEVFKDCLKQLETHGMSLQNLSHVTLTLQNQETQYAEMNKVWNELFPNPQVATTRTCVFNKAQPALVHIATRTSPSQICVVNESALG